MGQFRRIIAGMLLALALTSPAAAQSLTSSDGEKFIKAMREDDTATALPLMQQPGSYVINFRGYDGDTALHVVTRKRGLTWLRYLLSRGADPNIGDAKGDTPLTIAASIGYYDGVDALLRSSARVDATNRKGETALIIAVQQRQSRLVQRLLEAGADANRTDHVAGLSARDYAKRDARNPELLRLIENTKPAKSKIVGPSIN